MGEVRTITHVGGAIVENAYDLLPQEIRDVIDKNATRFASTVMNKSTYTILAEFWLEALEAFARLEDPADEDPCDSLMGDPVDGIPIGEELCRIIKSQPKKVDNRPTLAEVLELQDEPLVEGNLRHPLDDNVLITDITVPKGY